MSAWLLGIFVLCGKVNFSNLSRYSPYSERTYRRLFLQRVHFGQINQAFLEATVPTDHDLIAVMDASFLPKSGKHTFGLDRFYNGCQQRVEKGLELSLVGVVDIETEQAYTILAQQTVSQKETETAADFNRMDDYIAHLDAARSYLPERVKYLAVDGFYVKEGFLQAALNHRLQVISKLRSDANLRFVYAGEQKLRGRKRIYDGKVDFTDLSRFTHVEKLESGIDLYTAVVWQVRGKRKIRVAYLVNRTNPQKPMTAILFSTDLEQDPKQIYQFYRLRFQIEFIFRDGKQFTGLQDCQARDAKKLDFHLNSSLLALNLAKFQALNDLQPGQSFTFSMNNIKRKALNQHLLDLFILHFGLDSTCIKSHSSYTKLLNFGSVNY